MIKKFSDTMIRVELMDAQRDINECVSRLNKGLDIVGSDKFHDEEIKYGSLMHFFQTGYSSIESALMRLLIISGESLPIGDNKQRKVLTRAVSDYSDIRPAIISNKMEISLDILRVFRHSAIHNYESFVPESSELAQRSAKYVASNVQNEFQIFLQRMSWDDYE